MRFLIAGGTGFVGEALTERLIRRDHAVTILSRQPHAARSETAVDYASWDSADDLAHRVGDSDCVVNLAGASVAGHRWTDAYKKAIVSSRVQTTRRLVEAMAQSKRRPACLINASAIGYYGERGGEELTEESAPGAGFLADTCRQWEAEALKAEALGVRTVLLRISLVLGPGGGILQKMAFPFKLFAGGPVGNGRQWVSWIHLEDLTSLIEWSASHPGFKGAVNASAPDPVRMKEFAASLGKALHRPSWFPVPEPLLRIVMGEAAELAVTSQRVLPRKAKAAGFEFRFKYIDDALVNVFHA